MKKKGAAASDRAGPVANRTWGQAGGAAVRTACRKSKMACRCEAADPRHVLEKKGRSGPARPMHCCIDMRGQRHAGGDSQVSYQHPHSRGTHVTRVHHGIDSQRNSAVGCSCA